VTRTPIITNTASTPTRTPTPIVGASNTPLPPTATATSGQVLAARFRPRLRHPSPLTAAVRSAGNPVRWVHTSTHGTQPA
jgi:hypothetical protein